MKRAAAVLVVLLVLVGHPAPADASPDIARADAEWILQAQLPDGAIAHHVDRVAIWPYLANFAALGLIRAAEVTGDETYLDAAWRWLAWYQAHQDADGFVTDYTVVAGTPVSTGTMDSTDAYAGTFLLTVREAWRVSGDDDRLASLAAGVEGAVRAIEATQDADGLTWAKPSWRVKYLMDQAETYAGLVAAVDIAAALGESTLGTRASTAATRLRQGVDGLWNPATGAYDWAVHDDGTRQPTNWTQLYPDALQQVWAVAFGLVDDVRATDVVARFATAQPQWDQPASLGLLDGVMKPTGYWAQAGWAFARVGDAARAATAADRIRSAATATGRAWPFTPGDAGALTLLAEGSSGFGFADPATTGGTVDPPAPAPPATTTTTTAAPEATTTTIEKAKVRVAKRSVRTGATTTTTTMTAAPLAMAAVAGGGSSVPVPAGLVAFGAIVPLVLRRRRHRR